MIRKYAPAGIYILLMLGLSTLHSAASERTVSQRPPNFIIIFTDDQGYGDLSCFGSPLVHTPAIDRLAQEGAKLTSFYVAAPVCTPSRAALMTGCYPKRTSLATGSSFGVLLPNDPKGLHPQEITLAEVLKTRGYATGIFGKWHLGDLPQFLPTRQGFDEFFGIPYSHDIHPFHPNPDWDFPPLPLLDGECVIETDPDADYLTRRITNRAVKFIRDHQAEPFFLYIPHPIPHNPLHVSPGFMETVPDSIRSELALENNFVNYRARENLYAQAISEIDWSVDKIMEALKKQNLDENTLVIFTSDNGPGTRLASAGPLRGRKGSTFEGGMREPAVAWWPGKIEAGAEIDELLTAMDLLPTFAGLAGAEIPHDRVIDGKDIWPVLSGEPGAGTPHDRFFYHQKNQLNAVRSGPWKYHWKLPGAQSRKDKYGNVGVLYNLDEDIAETNDLSREHPEIVQRLKGYLEEFEAELGSGDSLSKNCRPAGWISKKPEKPNVIFVLTDDQGYGDLSCHGNPVLKTPNLDQLYEESIRFSDFHVAPMCTPTRGELLTGMNAFRNGATAVCEGRSLPRRELPMMAQFFRNNGYSTGHFGKWHLGDNYPYRPQDRGFQETIHNQAWGIKSLAEYPENNTVDDCYWHNNQLEQFKGYNTDVFFREAMNWIEEVHQDGPFFAYIPTTAAHSPFWVNESFSGPYDTLPRALPRFYGMISNIDSNMARLEAFLKKYRLKENTLLIFMSDNGTVLGETIFNAGMRGHKTSEYDGGHRVPFFLRWPAAGYNQGRDINALTHSTDLLPTLIDLCGLDPGNLETRFNGHSLRPLLEGEEDALQERMVVVQYRANFKPWSGAVLWKKWRLVNGKELYDVGSDLGQTNNLYDLHPDVVQVMRNYYENWVTETKPMMDQKNYVSVGTSHESVTWLSACNWTGSYADNWGNLADANGNKFGHWNLDPVSTGEYEVSLYIFHPALQTPLNQGYGGFAKVPARPVAKAQLLLEGEAKTVNCDELDTHATFTIALEEGRKVSLEGKFLDKEGTPLCGAFYTFVRKINKDSSLPIPEVIDYVSPHIINPLN